MVKQTKLTRAIRQASLKVVPFDGGVDLVSPSLTIRPGTLRESQNFELDLHGGIRSL